jgi:hypothetical protein
MSVFLQYPTWRRHIKRDEDEREDFRTRARQVLVPNMIITAEPGSQTRTTVLTVVARDSDKVLGRGISRP